MPRSVTLCRAPASRHTSATAGSPTASMHRLVARLPERTIMRSASHRRDAVPPMRAQVSVSESSTGSLPKTAPPGSALRWALCTVTGASRSRPLRCSATRTATFIVLAP